MSLHGETYERRLIWRHRMGQAFEWLCRIATFSALAMLVILLLSILVTAISPGRGRGLAAVSISSVGDAGRKSVDTRLQVSRALGGHFEFKDQPDDPITSFSVEDVQSGRVLFRHDGRRTAPAVDLVVTGVAGAETADENVESGKSTSSMLVVDPAPRAAAGGWLTWRFLTSFNSDDPFDAGILAGLWGSIWLVALTGLMAVPLGVGAAVYLEEYSKPTRFTKTIQLNIANLAGVPSIVYGILGFTVFARMFGVFDGGEKKILSLNLYWFKPLEIPLPFGPVVFSGACTLALLSLPVIIISSQEALRAVPGSLRHAAYALGATKWQTIRHQVLPAALPGILTGVILSLSRAIGEAAPLAVLGVAAHLSFCPGRIAGPGDLIEHSDKLLRAPFDKFTALPIQIYSWINEASPNFENVAAAGILVLLAALLTMNGAAIFIRQRFQQKIRW